MTNHKPKVFFIIMVSIIFLMGMQYNPSMEERIQEAPYAKTGAQPFEKEPVLVSRKVAEKENKKVILTTYPLLARQGDTLISATDIKQLIPNLKIKTNSDHSIVEVQKLKRLYFPINREIYFEMDTVQNLKGAAEIVEDEVYLPLRPIFESFGYQVHYNSHQNEILYSYPYRKKTTLISTDKVQDPARLSTERDGLKSEIFSYYHGSLNGYRQDHDSFSVDFTSTDLKGNTEVIDTIPLKAPMTAYLSDDQLNYFFCDGFDLYGYNLERGTVDNLNLPLQLKQTHFMGYTRDKFYFYNEGEVYYYYYKNKRVEKLPIEGLPNDMTIAKGKGFFTYGDKLIALDLKTFKGSLIDIDRGVDAFTILMRQGNYLLYRNNHQGIYVVYDLIKDESVYAIPWGGETTPYLNLSEGKYLLVQFDKELDVYDLNLRTLTSFDITNIISDYPHGKIQWYTDGFYLDGIWNSQLELDEPISRKLIRVKP